MDMKDLPILLLAIFFLCVCSYAQNPSAVACPTVEVLGPDSLPEENEIIIFKAKIYGQAKDFEAKYEWTISRGEIAKGQGTSEIKVKFNGDGFTASVEIKNFPAGCPNLASESFYFDPPPKAVLFDEINGCPRVSVKTSDIGVIDGYPMTFTAKVSDAGTRKLKYKWTLSNGEILEGQGTPEIKVDTLGYQGEAIKATVKIYGLPKSCKTRAFVTGFVKPKPYLNEFSNESEPEAVARGLKTIAFTFGRATTLSLVARPKVMVGWQL